MIHISIHYAAFLDLHYSDFQHCSIIFIQLWEAQITIEVKIWLNVQS